MECYEQCIALGSNPSRTEADLAYAANPTPIVPGQRVLRHRSEVILLAQFQLGQLLLSQRSYSKSLSMFEQLLAALEHKQAWQLLNANGQAEGSGSKADILLQNHICHRDVIAYIMLIKAAYKGEVCSSVDKVADALSGSSFPLAYELWLLQVC